MANKFTGLTKSLLALSFLCFAGLTTLNAQISAPQAEYCPEIEVLPDGTVIFTFPGPAGGDDGYPITGIGTGSGFPSSVIYTGSGSFTTPNTVFTFEPNNAPFPPNLTGTLVMDFSGTGFIVCDYVDGVLPLTLIKFDGHTTDQNTNVLEWVTASESNTAWIILERSSNVTDWELVERLPAQGWSSEMHNYSAEDTNPYAVTYYRLRIVDLDGLEYFSNIVVLERNTLSGVVISPVPARDAVYMQFDASESGELSLAITDVLGRELSREIMPIQVGLNTQQIDISKLPVGLYYVTVDNGVDSHTKRIIKQ